MNDQPETWYLARCIECGLPDQPFRSEEERDGYAAGHRRSGHTVRLITERSWRDPQAPQVRRHPPPAPGGLVDEVYDLCAEMLALTPYVEAAKRGSDHDGHQGWQMTRQLAGVVQCSCGEPLDDLLRGWYPPPDVGG